MICAPLMAESVEQMLSDMHQAKMDGADVVEIRLDCISNFQPHRDLKLLLENKPLPVVVVYGPTWEGGEYEGDEQERLQALLLAKDLGADYIELELKSIGAVNTIVRRPDDGKLVGHNTDCEAGITAIEDALKEALLRDITSYTSIAQECTISEVLNPSPLMRKLFVLVGAGGAGRALAFGAKTRGARVVIFDIDFDRAKSLAAAVSGKALPFEDLIGFRPEKDAILANATPLGMHQNTDRIPVPEETLRDYKLVFDAVYTPRKTRLLKEAEAAGAIVVSGVEMFLRQATAQFSLFTGHKGFKIFTCTILKFFL
ncbi:UNVERIFIED_CONTAM: Bifunctional 3-dehydroquinate dehydratase/shikimate dehydrogenase, chloroplastic [Sesamum radiatum]|uniref:Bifunctional 3-dehydroquinate dehydratase/shikimate dehydrogenase, chloroplastic n=1 Tax=Sesamum radiatum TaxID=300843 RepID=A0AAW2VCJ5_SESRA